MSFDVASFVKDFCG